MRFKITPELLATIQAKHESAINAAHAHELAQQRLDTERAGLLGLLGALALALGSKPGVSVNTFDFGVDADGCFLTVNAMPEPPATPEP
jgi:hypothetical protein